MSRILLLLPLLLLSTGVFTSGAARASCGDWLVHSPPAAASDNVTADANRPAPPAEAPCPCQGPGCGQQPVDSVPTPSGPTTQRPSDVACWLPVRCDVSFHLAGLLGSSVLRLPSGVALGIDRPPKS
ncbi:hypothetical protein [Roseimaritima ulvae]|uniref:hypothetical protein n=1 Tax=Roseimaritima ulvae TaxID=980254 RepID=UPI0011CD3E40|nr:hypothetical protein [Roseimaritima ulvae]